MDHPGKLCDNDTSPIYNNVCCGFHPGIMGGSNISHKIFPRIFLDRTVCYKQGGYPPGGWYRGYKEGVWGCLVCQASLMNSFFNLCIVATLTLVSFDVTRML